MKQNFEPTEKFTDTLFGLIPEIAKLGIATLTTIGTSIATKSTKAGRTAGFGVYQSLTAPQIAKAEYDESMDFFKKNGANDQLAKELSANVVIHNVVINAGLERLAIGRYLKQIVPPKFKKNFIKQQAEAARNRILKNTVATFKVWAPFAYKEGNPDLLEYTGLGEINVMHTLIPDKIMFDLNLRKGLCGTRRGLTQLPAI